MFLLQQTTCFLHWKKRAPFLFYFTLTLTIRVIFDACISKTPYFMSMIQTFFKKYCKETGDSKQNCNIGKLDWFVPFGLLLTEMNE